MDKCFINLYKKIDVIEDGNYNNELYLFNNYKNINSKNNADIDILLNFIFNNTNLDSSKWYYINSLNILNYSSIQINKENNIFQKYLKTDIIYEINKIYLKNLFMLNNNFINDFDSNKNNSSFKLLNFIDNIIFYLKKDKDPLWVNILFKFLKNILIFCFDNNFIYGLHFFKCYKFSFIWSNIFVKTNLKYLVDEYFIYELYIFNKIEDIFSFEFLEFNLKSNFNNLYLDFISIYSKVKQDNYIFILDFLNEEEFVKNFIEKLGFNYFKKHNDIYTFNELFIYLFNKDIRITNYKFIIEKKLYYNYENDLDLYNQEYNIKNYELWKYYCFHSMKIIFIKKFQKYLNEKILKYINNKNIFKIEKLTFDIINKDNVYINNYKKISVNILINKNINLFKYKRNDTILIAKLNTKDSEVNIELMNNGEIKQIKQDNKSISLLISLNINKYKSDIENGFTQYDYQTLNNIIILNKNLKYWFNQSKLLLNNSNTSLNNNCNNFKQTFLNNPKLNNIQIKAIQDIINMNGNFLIHGNINSGKKFTIAVLFNDYFKYQRNIIISKNKKLLDILYNNINIENKIYNNYESLLNEFFIKKISVIQEINKEFNNNNFTLESYIIYYEQELIALNNQKYNKYYNFCKKYLLTDLIKNKKQIKKLFYNKYYNTLFLEFDNYFKDSIYSKWKYDNWIILDGENFEYVNILQLKEKFNSNKLILLKNNYINSQDFTTYFKNYYYLQYHYNLKEYHKNFVDNIQNINDNKINGVDNDLIIFNNFYKQTKENEKENIFAEFTVLFYVYLLLNNNNSSDITILCSNYNSVYLVKEKLKLKLCYHKNIKFPFRITTIDNYSVSKNNILIINAYNYKLDLPKFMSKEGLFILKDTSETLNSINFLDNYDIMISKINDLIKN